MMMTLTEIKKELKKFKTANVRAILVQEDEDTNEYIVDVCATVTDVYNNFDSEFITIGEFETEAKAMKHAKMLATKLNTKVEVGN
jgi:hypothetical protein